MSTPILESQNLSTDCIALLELEDKLAKSPKMIFLEHNHDDDNNGDDNISSHRENKQKIGKTDQPMKSVNANCKQDTRGADHKESHADHKGQKANWSRQVDRRIYMQ